jgi:Cof subfamily protein (haloacid dehalogenase superfamily)
MIRLILIDVDGTLVGANGVPESAWTAIDRARARGVHLGLCTGRIGVGATREYARRVSAVDLHIFQSGAVVSRADAPAVRASVLPEDAYRALVGISRREGEPLEVYTEHGFYLERESELTRVHARALDFAPEIHDLLTLPSPPVRAQWVVDGKDWPKFRDLTLAVPGLSINPASAPWSPGSVFSNVTRLGTSKVSALRWIASHNGIGREHVAMIGDGENDLEAIQAAGLGIAMGNAPEAVRAKADATVADVDAGGLAEAIALVLASA